MRCQITVAHGTIPTLLIGSPDRSRPDTMPEREVSPRPDRIRYGVSRGCQPVVPPLRATRLPAAASCAALDRLPRNTALTGRRHRHRRPGRRLPHPVGCHPHGRCPCPSVEQTGLTAIRVGGPCGHASSYGIRGYARSGGHGARVPRQASTTSSRSHLKAQRSTRSTCVQRADRATTAGG